ncbi:MAG: Thymidylate synthase [Syntrophorhabdaceae bacterium PtaU1.Bin034]|nr:MAG: Thymidylate synthase [Syntrophorhabdaceae bacterium PtaU1.Bin034]
MTSVLIEARDLPDAWFQCIYRIFEDDCAREYEVQKGSFEGIKRRQFDIIMVNINHPGTRPLIPDIPIELGIPQPTSMEYVENYLQYLMTDKKKENEVYTYGERLTNPKVSINGQEVSFGINPVEEVIRTYRDNKHGTNQAIMEVGMPQDIVLEDPPCLRLIDTRLMEGKLNFVLYFRSWDLWAGFPSNLAAIQLLKEYMCQEVGVEDGSIVAVSKGLHLYEYSFALALKRLRRA